MTEQRSEMLFSSLYISPFTNFFPRFNSCSSLQLLLCLHFLEDFPNVALSFPSRFVQVAFIIHIKWINHAEKEGSHTIQWRRRRRRQPWFLKIDLSPQSPPRLSDAESYLQYGYSVLKRAECTEFFGLVIPFRDGACRTSTPLSYS